MQNTANDKDPKLHLIDISDEELKKNTFKTPDGYFENLTPRVMESVRSSEDTMPGKVFDLNKFMLPAFGIAAMALVALFLFNPSDQSDIDFETTLASLTLEELTEYADLQPYELVAYELVDYDQNSFEETELSEEEILQYLQACSRVFFF